MVKYHKPHSDSVKKVLIQSGTLAKKWLGQHFLIEPDVLKTMVSAAELTADDTVIEIGPGLGILTEHRVGKKRLRKILKAACFLFFR